MMPKYVIGLYVYLAVVPSEGRGPIICCMCISVKFIQRWVPWDFPSLTQISPLKLSDSTMYIVWFPNPLKQHNIILEAISGILQTPRKLPIIQYYYRKS